MRVFKLADMVSGWFVGNFSPTALSTAAAEVGVKTYRAGDAEAGHVHRIATELTLVLAGEVEMNGRRFGAGDIAVLAPGEPGTFRAISDTTTVVVKLPSAPGDKYRIDAAG